MATKKPTLPFPNLSDEAIVAVLNRFTVRNHYVATANSKVTKYAVFDAGKVITKPDTHAASQAARLAMTTAALRELFGTAA